MHAIGYDSEIYSFGIKIRESHLPMWALFNDGFDMLKRFDNTK